MVAEPPKAALRHQSASVCIVTSANRPGCYQRERQLCRYRHSCRETPELPADILFSDIEIMALRDFASDRKLPAPGNLGLAVLTMAMLGGYLNRKNDPWPGHEKIWEGYTRLAVAAQTYERLIRMDRTSDLYQRLRPDKTCG